MNGAEAFRPQIGRAQNLALVAGVAALGACVAGAVGNYPQFLHSYLLAFLFWFGIALGSAAVVMVHHLTGGGWGFIIRRLLESAMRTVPFTALMFVPLLFGLPQLYVWARPEAVAADEALRAKSAYLNSTGFVIRAAVYFAIWMTLTWLLARRSREQDETGDPRSSQRLRSLSAPGLVIYGVTITFASIDWAMSLEPHFYSTIYGMLFMIGQALSAIAFVVFLAGFLAREEPIVRTASKSRLNDLGNIMFAFVMLWAYISFSQFLIIWSGNLPEEITWYTRRLHGGWAVVALGLVIFHFALPFLVLLSREVKQRARRLRLVAAWLIVMRLVDLFWVLAPAESEAGLRVHWMDAAATVGLGGIWLALFLWQLKRRPLVPVNDPEYRGLFKDERHGATA